MTFQPPTVQRPRPDARTLIFQVGSRRWFFSYATLIAYQGPEAPNGIRLDVPPSPTTARHMAELGVSGWRAVTAAELAEVATPCCLEPIPGTR